MRPRTWRIATNTNSNFGHVRWWACSRTRAARKAPIKASTAWALSRCPKARPKSVLVNVKGGEIHRRFDGARFERARWIARRQPSVYPSRSRRPRSRCRPKPLQRALRIATPRRVSENPDLHHRGTPMKARGRSGRICLHGSAELQESENGDCERQAERVVRRRVSAVNSITGEVFEPLSV